MISIIVATDLNNGIGYNNNIPWYIPEEMLWFKHKTLFSTIILGSKTFQSLGNKELPNRNHIILSKKNNNLLIDVIKECNNNTNEEYFIIGGSEIYKEALELDVVDRIYKTVINKNYDCDKFFPVIDENKFNLKYVQKFIKHGFEIQVFDRMK